MDINRNISLKQNSCKMQESSMFLHYFGEKKKIRVYNGINGVK